MRSDNEAISNTGETIRRSFWKKILVVDYGAQSAKSKKVKKKSLKVQRNLCAFLKGTYVPKYPGYVAWIPRYLGSSYTYSK